MFSNKKLVNFTLKTTFIINYKINQPFVNFEAKSKVLLQMKQVLS